MIKYVTAEEAVKVVQSNNRVYIQAAAATPTLLTNALTARASELRNVEICHLHTEGEARYAHPEFRDSFHVNSFFIGKNVRHTIQTGNGSYTPVFLSELPNLFRKKQFCLTLFSSTFRRQTNTDIVRLELLLKPQLPPWNKPKLSLLKSINKCREPLATA